LRGEGRGEGQPQTPEHARTAGTAGDGTQAVAILDGIRHRFVVPPGGSVVDAALTAGIRVPYACKGGMCCSCRAKLVEGAADMKVNYSLEPWEMERGFILTCQAVPKSDRIVLDYDQM
jgi:ring-1,2-phenylacetyl-CoA epoxidase subunit PaaE